MPATNLIYIFSFSCFFPVYEPLRKSWFDIQNTQMYTFIFFVSVLEFYWVFFFPVRILKMEFFNTNYTFLKKNMWIKIEMLIFDKLIKMYYWSSQWSCSIEKGVVKVFLSKRYCDRSFFLWTLQNNSYFEEDLRTAASITTENAYNIVQKILWILTIKVRVWYSREKAVFYSIQY